MDLQKLNNYTKKELIVLSKKHNLKNLTNLKKEEIIEKLKKIPDEKSNSIFVTFKNISHIIENFINNKLKKTAKNIQEKITDKKNNNIIETSIKNIKTKPNIIKKKIKNVSIKKTTDIKKSNKNAKKESNSMFITFKNISHIIEDFINNKIKKPITNKQEITNLNKKKKFYVNIEKKSEPLEKNIKKEIKSNINVKIETENIINKKENTSIKELVEKKIKIEQKLTKQASFDSINENKQPFIDKGPELPKTYYQDKLIILIKDPNWAYAYWETSGLKSLEFSDYNGDNLFINGKWLLKLYNQTNKKTYTIPILIDSKSWFFMLKSDSKYIAELGVYSPKNQYLTYVQSNSFSSPSKKISTIIDEKWVSLDEKFKKIILFSGVNDFEKKLSISSAINFKLKNNFSSLRK